MNQIANITQDPVQNLSLVLPSGYTLSFTLTFVDRQIGWFISNLSYLSFSLNGMRVVNSPNMLQQYLNQINFGLACFSTTSREPMFIQDFYDGASSLYVLTAAEVAQYQASL